MSDEQIDHEAAAFITLLWRDLYNRIRELMHPHHFTHEPGGKDEVRLPLGYLLDVTLTDPSDKEALTYDEPSKTWVNGAGGGGAHQAFMAVPLPAPPSSGGPLNLQATARSITRIFIEADGEVSGTVSGASFGFGPAGGTADITTSYSWASGARLNVSVSYQGGDGTMLYVDWLSS